MSTTKHKSIFLLLTILLGLTLQPLQASLYTVDTAGDGSIVPGQPTPNTFRTALTGAGSAAGNSMNFSTTLPNNMNGQGATLGGSSITIINAVPVDLVGLTQGFAVDGGSLFGITGAGSVAISSSAGPGLLQFSNMANSVPISIGGGAGSATVRFNNVSNAAGISLTSSNSAAEIGHDGANFLVFTVGNGTYIADVAPGMTPLSVGVIPNLSSATLNVVGSATTLSGLSLTLVNVSGSSSPSNNFGTVQFNGITFAPGSANAPYTLIYNSVGVDRNLTSIVLTFNRLNGGLVPAIYGTTGSNLSNACGYNMAIYLDSLSPASGTDLNFVVSTLNSMISAGNISGAQAALAQMNPSIMRDLGGLAFNSGIAIAEAGRGQIQSWMMKKSFEKETKTLTKIAPKRLASFQDLANRQLLTAKNGLHQQQGLTQPPQRKGPLAHMKFTNGPEQVNRHPQAGRVRMGKANVWVQPYGQMSSQRACANGNCSPGLNSDLGGLALGADYEVADNTLVGVLGGMSTTSFDWYQGRGKGKMNSGYGGLYAGWKEENGFYVEGQTIFGGNKFFTKRNINFSNINRVATANHVAFQFTGNLEVGYAAPVYDWFTVQPFMFGDYMFMRDRAYTESGAQSLNMSIAAKDSQFFQWDLGVMMYKAFAVNEILLYPTAELGWINRRPFSNGQIRGGLEGQPDTLVVTGTNKMYNQFAPGLGLTAQFPNGLYVSTNVYGAVGDGLNIGQALVRVGYEF